MVICNITAICVATVKVGIFGRARGDHWPPYSPIFSEVMVLIRFDLVHLAAAAWLLHSEIRFVLLVLKFYETSFGQTNNTTENTHIHKLRTICTAAGSEQRPL